MSGAALWEKPKFKMVIAFLIVLGVFSLTFPGISWGKCLVDTTAKTMQKIELIWNDVWLITLNLCLSGREALTLQRQRSLTRVTVLISPALAHIQCLVVHLLIFPI